MKMGTCEQQVDQQEAQGERMNAEEENNLMITGPPASRTVIDNLKKLLVQRQHSRESDTENNKNAARSNSGSNSDAAFYSQFSTSSSDSSDDSSDDYMFFQEISNQANGTSANHTGRRRHRRRRSYSSSSSSSPSPVARNRRKITRVNVGLSNSIGGDGGLEGIVTSAPSPSPQDELPSGLEESGQQEEMGKEERDSANSTSSHKDSSSSDDDFPGGNCAQQQQQPSSAEAAGPAAAGRCPKLKSRRDRDRKRKRSDLNYATHRPKLVKSSKDNPHREQQCSSVDVVTSATGGEADNNPSVPTITVSSPSSNSAIDNCNADVNANGAGEPEVAALSPAGESGNE